MRAASLIQLRRLATSLGQPRNTYIRQFATVAPDIHLLFQNATRSAPTPLKSLWNGLLSAVVQPDDLANQYRKKYADKLKRAAESEGVASVDELLEKKRSAGPPPPPEDDQNNKPDEQQRPTKKAQSAARRADGLPSHVKGLHEIVNIDRIKQETPETITNIWNKYHFSRECLSGVMPSAFYDELMGRSKQFPMFIVPLPRNEGYEFFLLQFSGHQVYFTPLLEYKTHRENARPHLVLTHYVELAEEKSVVLMVGELGDRKLLTLQEAQNLVYQMQMWYVTGKQEKKDLVEIFHRNPAQFDYQSLITAVETLE